MEQPALKPLLLDLLDFVQQRQQMLLAELNDSEREVSGTPALWAARDHIAHITFWKQHLVLTLAALARSETPPVKGNAEVLNPQVFEEQRQRPWPDILLEAQQVHADLLTNLQPFTDADLARDLQLAHEGEDGTVAESQPLWSVILSQGFWHPLEHFTQFYLDRDDVLHASRVQQAWADRVMQPGVPPFIQSIGLYTLALFYATTKQEAPTREALRQATAINPDPTMESIVLYHLARFYASTNQKSKAQETLSHVLALNPALSEFCEQDPDLRPLLEE